MNRATGVKPPKLSEYINDYARTLSKNPLIDLYCILNYTKFITQPITKGMFVPVGEDGEVLEEPINKYKNNNTSSRSTDDYTREFIEHKKAMDNVLFEGWNSNKKNYCTNGNLRVSFYEHSIGLYDIAEVFDLEPRTIEDILHLVTLTDKKAKELGLC